MTMARVLVSAALLLGLVARGDAIGFCREDNLCQEAPTAPGQTCSCWSTCHVTSKGRKCDGANKAWSGYRREQIGESDVGCKYVPIASNCRDLCVWYVDEETEARE